MTQNQYNDLYQELARSTAHSAQEWQEAVELARSYFKAHDLSDELLSRLAQASGDISLFNLIIKECYRSSQNHPDRARPFKTLLQYCDDSIYSLKEWLAAYLDFHHYLDQHKRRDDFIVMLGYLQCCSLSPENKDIKHDFKDLLHAMLDQYGFVGKNLNSKE